MDKKPIIFMVVFFIVGSLACNLLSPGAIEQAVKDAGEGVAQTAIAMGESTAQALASTAVSDAMTPEAPQATPVTESGAPPAVEQLESLSVGIDQLQSYRLSFVMQINGTDAQGQAQSGSIEMQQATIRTSGDKHMSISTSGFTGNETPEGTMEFYQVGGVMYMLTPGDATNCIGINSSDAAAMPDILDSSELIDGVQGLKLVERGVMVNDIQTDHYTFEAQSISSGSFTSGQGDVWLAQEGGYVMRMTGTATGDITSMNVTEGTLDWTYELDDVNGVSEIVVPESCTAPAGSSGEIPLPENVTDQSSFGNMLTFNTAATPKEIADFYVNKLSELGWQQESITEMDPLYVMRYTKDGKSLDITISGDDSITTVIVVQGP